MKTKRGVQYKQLMDGSIGTYRMGQFLTSGNTFSKVEFSPSRQQLFDIAFKLDEPAEVGVRIYTSDGNLVRELSGDVPFEPGVHMLKWDGKDFEGEIVPDEAYTVVLHATNKSRTTTLDPREKSGGEVEKVASTAISKEGKITYTLSKPSRVQIRAGIVDGPMMRSLATWQPRPAGKNVQRWNGFDADKTINLFSLENHGVSVTAFNLPDYTILTTGNHSLDYQEYYKKRNGHSLLFRKKNNNWSVIIKGYHPIIICCVRQTEIRN